MGYSRNVLIASRRLAVIVAISTIVVIVLSIAMVFFMRMAMIPVMAYDPAKNHSC